MELITFFGDSRDPLIYSEVEVTPQMLHTYSQKEIFLQFDCGYFGKRVESLTDLPVKSQFFAHIRKRVWSKIISHKELSL